MKNIIIGRLVLMAPPVHIRRLVSSLLLLLCICITFSSCISIEVHDGDEQGLDTIRGVNMTHPNACYYSEVPDNSFKIVHRFGPCSPLHNVTSDINYDEILRHDRLRVAYLQRRLRSRKTSRDTNTVDLQQGLVQTTIPVIPFAETGNPLFYVLVGLGTPRRIQSIDFDTGNSFSWIQCHPCQPCMPQQNPLFDPTLSQSYRTVSCNDPACIQLHRSIRGCTNNTCTYNLTYADSDTSKGIVSRDRLSLPTFAGDQFPNFVFGCGHHNMMEREKNAGFLGLGRGFHSLMAQTSSRFGHSFSYCLPSSVNVRGYLTLGHSEDASSIIYTPMLRNPRIDPDLYFINLTAISVANQRLKMPSQVIRRRGTVLDSGTAITHLPPYMYSQLRDAFRQGMSRYQYQLAPAYLHLDTCYSISMARFPYPNITLHFDGHADLVLSFDQVFFLIRGNTYCLTFSQIEPDTLLTIIGSSQQRGIEVIYNIEQERIGFYHTTNCR